MSSELSSESDKSSCKKAVYYDGGCPICTLEMSWVQKQQGAEDLEFVDITSAEFQAESYGISQSEFEKHIKGKDKEGNLVSGVEVFRQIYESLGYRRLVWFSRLPVVSQVMDAGYWMFAKVRVPLGNLILRLAFSRKERA